MLAKRIAAKYLSLLHQRRVFAEGPDPYLVQWKDALMGSGPEAQALKKMLELASHLTVDEAASDAQRYKVEYVPSPELREALSVAYPLLRKFVLDPNVKKAFKDIGLGHIPRYLLWGKGSWNEDKSPEAYAAYIKSLFTDRVVPLLNLKTKAKITLSKDARKWLESYKSFPRRKPPSAEIFEQLTRFRPKETKAYYRGIQFKDKGERDAFVETALGGKPFVFYSEDLSSWSTSKEVATRFATLPAATSEIGNLIGLFSKAKTGKPYTGHGGYVIMARVRPEDILVDYGHPDIPSFGSYGTEAEAIVLPYRKLVGKVVASWGTEAEET